MRRPQTRTAAGLLGLATFALLGVACNGGEAGGPTAPTGSPMAEIEFESFQLVNSARRDSNVQPQLDFEDSVARVARAHSRAMRDHGFFGHNGPDGGLRARLRAAGIQFGSAGENLAKLVSVPNPAGQAHALFLDSSEHRQVMLDSRFRSVGVGVARSGDTYWLTQVYISP